MEDHILEIWPDKELKREDFILKNVDTTMNFPFLTDWKTARHIKNSHTMFILRGLPGSGKSTIVRNIQAVYPNSVTCSADDHFLVDGEYRFDASGLKEAHAECQQKARKSCESGIPVVIVDNTNVRHWEMRFYFNLARHTNYTVVIVETRTPWKFNPEELAKRNKHGVEEEILRGKVFQFDRLSPVYYGWFVTERGSKDVTYIAKLLFKECLKYCPDYYQLLKNTTTAGMKTKSSSDRMNDDENVANYFSWSTSADHLHCTAKFCNKGKAPGAYWYQHRQDVEESVGKASVLQVVGFTFSRDSVGARIQLNDEQLSLFDKPEERGRDDLLARNAAVQARVEMVSSPHQLRPCIQRDVAGGRSLYPAQSVTDKTKVSCNSFSLATIPPPQGFGRSAHCTICCADGVKPVQTTFDILDICDIENRRKESLNFVPVMGGRAAYIGDGFCVVYLYKPVTVSSLFSAYYV